MAEEIEVGQSGFGPQPVEGIRSLIDDADTLIKKYTELGDKAGILVNEVALICGQVSDILAHFQAVLNRIDTIVPPKQ